MIRTVAALAILFSALSPAAVPQAGPDPRVASLPEALRPEGTRLLSEKDERERARMAGAFAQANLKLAADFLVALLESDPSVSVRLAVVNRLRSRDPKYVAALEARAVSDSDAGVALAALERLRANRMEELLGKLETRLEAARGNEAELAKLAAAHERWISLAKGTMLPAFLQAPPPVFAVKPAGAAVRVLAFGDYGTGSESQRSVSSAMLRYHRRTPFDFGITLGDNFYSEGMESPTDPRWKTWWEDMYAPLEMQLYATMGNHDWGLPDSPAAEMLYSARSRSWRMPAAYYTFTAGAAQFFAIDTNRMSQAQLRWLEVELDHSRARWKVVYGHHPIYSDGVHGDNSDLIRRLLPVLRSRADVFLAGHDHDMQHLRAEGGVHFFVAGVGGAGVRRPTPGPRSLFARDIHGFAVVEIDDSRLKIEFHDTALASLYRYTLSKETPTGGSR
jgi:tartrate-resistant acid phosphatase type 5